MKYYWRTPINNTLLVTEKCGPNELQRDGGARLVNSIQQAFGNSLSIMQFGPEADSSATWHLDYPIYLPNRFERRIANANFIAQQIKAVEQKFVRIIFVHISMQFGLINLPLQERIQTWTFPMFLTPSYVASKEIIPKEYLKMERLALSNSKNIITPSHLEKRQLIDLYSIPEERIRVIPRGVNTKFLKPTIRLLNGPPKFCSIGSIKLQKNTLGLIDLFAAIHLRYPGSTLKIIGPVQDSKYLAKVVAKIQHLKLEKVIELTGYVAPYELASAIEDTHMHLSTSTCETFGRSLFETLASGLPNIARATENAAYDFLNNSPYIRFVDNNKAALDIIEEMLVNLSKLSALALEVGELYNDEILSKLLIAEICNKDVIAISDFDGTLFHKNDSEKTQRCIEAFRNFPIRVICSARPIHDLLDKLKFYNLEVDWIIGCSGSIVTDSHGKALWLIPMKSNDVAQIKLLVPQAKFIEAEGEVLQIAVPVELLPKIFGLRIEIYQQLAFIANWEASKFRAVHRLLRHIDWSGQVRTFGDGPYDNELLTYFDGNLITASTHDLSNKGDKNV